MKIIIAPYSNKLDTGKINPKNYPHWPEVVKELKAIGYEIIQLGVQGDERVPNVDQFVVGASFKEIRGVIDTANCWASVDSFLPHLCHCYKLKRGIVVWGPSDPVIFGHPENVNLLRSRSYLRPHQFQTWKEFDYDPQAFVTADKVVDAITKLAPMLSRGIPLLMSEPLRSC